MVHSTLSLRRARGRRISRGSRSPVGNPRVGLQSLSRVKTKWSDHLHRRIAPKHCWAAKLHTSAVCLPAARLALPGQARSETQRHIPCRDIRACQFRPIRAPRSVSENVQSVATIKTLQAQRVVETITSIDLDWQISSPISPRIVDFPPLFSQSAAIAVIHVSTYPTWTVSKSPVARVEEFNHSNHFSRFAEIRPKP